MKGWRFCCCVWFLGIALDGDSDSDGLVMLDVMNEVELSLANTGAGSSAVPGPSYVSSVSDPWQRVAAVSHGLTPVKEHLALMVARLKDCGFDLLAAFAELLAATFALSDALFAATPAAFFWDSSRGFALASFGLSPAAVVPWGNGWPVARPRLLSAVPGEACCTDGRDDGSCDVLGSIAGCEEAGRDSRKIGHWITLEISGRKG